MTINNVSELNGSYSIIYQTDAPDLDFVWFDHTNATAKLTNGVLIGNDAGGATWNAKFELLADGRVQFIADVDTKNAPAATFILDKGGRPTRLTQQYAGNLRLIAFEGEITLTGTVTHGVVEITVQLKRI